jgi:glycosyltransferase involved in cell wall biosynthesis
VKNKLAIVDRHPVGYKVGIWKTLEAKNNINFDVIFLDNIGLKEYYDNEFKLYRKSEDNDDIKGYKHKLLKNHSIWNTYSGFLSRINLELIPEILKNNYHIFLIHGYDNFSMWLTLLLSKLIGKKIIWRGEAVFQGNENNNTLKNKIKKIILNFFFNRCDVVMYSCTGNKDYLKFYGVDEKKLFPIPCAVDNTFFLKEKERLKDSLISIREELSIPIDDFVILFSARFTTRKRPFDLLNAINKIEHSNITILFVGDGLEKKNMEAYVENTDIKANFVGFQNRSTITKFYAISDLGIVISDYDPSPKAMNEIMNFNMPIITTNVVGTAYDLVEDGKNGFIVNVGDVEQISKKIDYLNKNRDISKNMGNKSLDIVSNWNYDKDVEGIENAIQFINTRTVY